MKGTQGLIIAAALGVVGAFCNWFYINRLAERREKVGFVMIRRDAQLNAGDRFQEQHFARVDIPRDNVGTLQEAAVLWQDRTAAIGYRAPKSYRGGELLLQQDLRTPAHRDLSDMLAENEVLRWVPVSSGQFVPEMLNPGNLISFEVPQLPGGKPADLSSRDLQTQPTEMIGPFRILALGTRTGTREVRQAAGMPSGPEHVIAISVRLENGQPEARAERLFRALRLSGNKALGVVLHSSKTKT